MSVFIVIPRLMEGIAVQCTLLRKATQALEQNSKRPAELKRLGAAHGAPDPIPVPLALATSPYVAARYNDKHADRTEYNCGGGAKKSTDSHQMASFVKILPNHRQPSPQMLHLGVKKYSSRSLTSCSSSGRASHISGKE
jgi:hypothetical protein